MIQYRNLKQWLLLKAIMLGKNRQGLVLVQRMANGKTGTYLVHKWIRPDQVDTTDKVLAGHLHLHSSHPQAPTDPKQYSHFSYRYSNAVKQQTAAFFNSLPNTQTFYQALHNLGITYTPDPTRPGITMMRAKGALNAAIHNGLDLTTFPMHLLGLNNPPPQVSIPPQTAPQTAPQTVPQTAPQTAAQTVPQAAAQTAPQTAPQAAATSSIVLPPRAKKASVASKAIATQFCDSFPNRQDFYDALTKMGITWTQTNHPGTTHMWAKCYLAQHIESGFDVNAAWAAIQSGGSTTAQSAPVAQSAQPAPAAQPAQTAPAAQQPTAPPVPPIDPDLIKIPNNATPEQRALGELINKMTDVDEINKCFILRAVPEDEIIKKYMFEVSLPKLKKWMSSIDQLELANNVAQFKKDMEEIGESFDNPMLSGSSPRGSYRDLASNILLELPVTGCKRSILADGINRGFKGLDMDIFTNAQDYIQTHKDSYKEGTVGVQKLLRNLGAAFAGYANDEQSNGTNQGYEGEDSEVYAKRYDVNKEGFVRVLQKIKQDNPTDPDVGAEVDSMIKDYDEMMSLIDGNPHILDDILNLKDWDNTPKKFMVHYNYGSEDFEHAKVMLQGIRAQTNVIINTLTQKGYTPDDIAKSLEFWFGTKNLSRYRIYNSKTDTEDTLDLTQEVDPESGKTLKQLEATDLSLHVSTYVIAELQNRLGISDAAAKHWYRRNGSAGKNIALSAIKKLETKAKITEQTFHQVHTLANKIFGITTDWTGTSSIRQATKEKINTPARNVILSNLILTHAFTESASNVALYVNSNSTSKFNNQGTDYSGNFNYYDGAHIPGTAYPQPISQQQIRRQYYSTATYTPQELDAKITEQLNLIPSYSSDYIKNLATLGSAALKDNSLTRMSNTTLDDLMDDPKKDVLYKTTVAMLSMVPQTVLKNPNLADKVAQKLDYVPYDFSVKEQPRLKPKPKQATTTPSSPLKAARERLFRVATCSLATEPPDVSKDFQQNCIENRLDYKPGEKDPDGTAYNGKLHPKFALLFNSPVFVIKNSVFKSNFDKMQTKLQTTCSDPECYTPMEVSHGCSRAAAANILERDGAFYVKGQYKKTATSLGLGVYASNKIGKNFAYVGDRAYGMGKSFDDPDAAHGCIIFATMMRGDNYTKSGSDSSKYTSSSAGHNRGWYEFEICARSNNLVNPHHFVDVSCVELGSSSGVSRDAQGNYVYNGKIIYDKDGRKVDVDWNYQL